jgi:transcription elongation factor GreA
MGDPVVMTAEDLAALTAEIERLEGPGRKAISARIKTAREWGDLKENAEYHDAKNDQAHLETRILVLRDKQKHAEIREAVSGGDTVVFGSTVEFEDVESGRKSTFTLVSPTEADPGKGRLSMLSPVANALEGAHVGDVVQVTTPRGERATKVLSIT